MVLMKREKQFEDLFSVVVVYSSKVHRRETPETNCPLIPWQLLRCKKNNMLRGVDGLINESVTMATGCQALIGYFLSPSGV